MVIEKDGVGVGGVWVMGGGGRWDEALQEEMPLQCSAKGKIETGWDGGGGGETGEDGGVRLKPPTVHVPINSLTPSLGAAGHCEL